MGNMIHTLTSCHQSELFWAIHYYGTNQTWYSVAQTKTYGLLYHHTFHETGKLLLSAGQQQITRTKIMFDFVCYIPAISLAAIYLIRRSGSHRTRCQTKVCVEITSCIVKVCVLSRSNINQNRFDQGPQNKLEQIANSHEVSQSHHLHIIFGRWNWKHSYSCL